MKLVETDTTKGQRTYTQDLRIFIIEKAWSDRVGSGKHMSFGYSPMGYITGKDDAEAYVKSKGVMIRNVALDGEGPGKPWYRCEELKNLEGNTSDE